MADEPRIRPIDAVQADVEQLWATVNTVNTQVGLLLFACAILSIAVGVLLWRR